MVALPTSVGAPNIPSGRSRPIVSINGSAGLGIAQNALAEGNGLKSIARGMQNMGDAGDIAFDRDNKLAARSQLTNFMNDVTPIMSSYKTLQGQDAVDAAPKVTKQLQDLQAKYSTASSNTWVKNYFDSSAQSIVQPEFEEIADHSGKAKVQAFKTNSDAAISAAANRATQGYNNPTKVSQGLLITKNEVLAQADMAGIHDENTRNEMVGEAQTKVLKSVIGNALATSGLDAGKALYTQYKDQISGDDRADLEQAFDVKQRAEQAQEEHAMVMAEHQRNLHQQDVDNGMFHQFVQGKLTPDMIDKEVSSGNLDATRGVSWINAIKETDKAKGEFTTNPGVFLQFYNSVSSGETTDRMKYVPFLGHGLTMDNINSLDAALSGKKGPGGDIASKLFDQFQKQITEELTASKLGVRDPKGQEALTGVLMKAMPAYWDGIAHNKTPGQLLDPKSPDFIAQGYQSHIRSPQQIMVDLIDANTGSPAGEAAVAQQFPYKTADDITSAVDAGSLDKSTLNQTLQQAIQLNLIKPSEAGAIAKKYGTAQ